jgi:hypothetical protein
VIFGPSESHPLFKNVPEGPGRILRGVKLFWNGFWTLDFGHWHSDFGLRTSDFGPFGASRDLETRFSPKIFVVI